MTSNGPRHPALASPEDPLAETEATEATDVSEIELSIPLDTVCAIIDLAHDLMGKTASSGDDDEPDEDDVRLSVLEDRGDDPADLELRSVIHDLGIEARVGHSLHIRV